MREEILMIDPDTEHHEMLRQAFGRRYRLRITDAAQCLEAVPGAHSCRVIIYNAETASPGTLELLERIRYGDPFERPIIVLAENNSLAFEKRLRAIGVFFFLIAPLDVTALGQVIDAGIRFWYEKGAGKF